LKTDEATAFLPAVRALAAVARAAYATMFEGR